jgi:hypothetical protein
MDFVEAKEWAEEEFNQARVWDKRCRKSLVSMAVALINQIGKSFSASCGKCLRQCGCRIFSKETMKPEDIQEGHYRQTAERASKEDTVLVPQDTVSFNETKHKATTGLGPIGVRPGSKGIYMHTDLVLTTEGCVLGIIGQQQWVRKEEERGKKHRRKSLPIEEKESYKWLLGHKQVCQRLDKCKQVYILSDRESDVYQYMVEPRPANIHIIFRAVQPRIIKAEIEGQIHRGRLTDLVGRLSKTGSKTVEITQEKKSVEISLDISHSNVVIYPPKALEKAAEPVKMTVIYAKEKDKKPDDDKAEWIILCDRQDLSNEEALLMVDYYSQRWKIERFHYTLKTGAFNVEKLQFDDAATLMNALAFYSVLACRVMNLTYYGRLHPESDPGYIIDEIEKEILEAQTGKKIETAREAIMEIGRLGGFLGGSKRYPYPGIKTLWAGLVTLEAMKRGWLLAKSQLVKRYAT